MRLRKWFIWSMASVVPLWLAAQQIEKITVVLRNRDVRSVAARVTEELGPQGQVWVDGSRNQVTVQDEPSRLAQVRRLLAELDSPARRFAIAAHLDVLPRAESRGLFKAAPEFVDMTAWADSARPTATYDCVVDITEGRGASCAMGKAYRFDALAQGYDPSRRRLALKVLSLVKIQEGKADMTVLKGEAVLPVGVPTVLMVNPTDQTPPLRLRATPDLLPEVQPPETR